MGFLLSELLDRESKASEAQKPCLVAVTPQGIWMECARTPRNKDPRRWEHLMKTGAVGDGGVSSDIGPGVGVVI